ncbi:MAG: hypothetical protein U0Z70_17935 [Thermomicrobiales bacterium]
MDSIRFDGFARAVATRLTRRTGLGLIAGGSLPLLGLAAATDAKKKKKITLCLNGQTVKKPKKKAKKLLKQGATKGACAGGCGSNQKLCNATCIPAGDCCVDTNCTGDDVCENGACVPLRCGNGGPCTVFMAAVNTGFTGSQIGGLAGGDAKCQAAADGANLSGTYKVWLSAGSDTPGTRFSNIAQAGPYRLVPNAGDGGNPPPTVAENFADLFTCGGGTCLNNAINRDENGQVQGGNPGVWTGTLANGNASADTCAGWTSTAGNGLIGSGTSNTTTWTENIPGACTGAFPIYCFQQAT